MNEKNNCEAPSVGIAKETAKYFSKHKFQARTLIKSIADSLRIIAYGVVIYAIGYSLGAIYKFFS